MPRHRAVAVVIHEGAALVMFRRNKREYFTFVGGGVDENESPEQAVVREVYEESSLVVSVGQPLYTITHDNGDVHYFYVCDYVSGTPHILEDTNEYRDIQSGRDYYEPRWLPIAELPGVELYPIEIRDRLVSDLESGFSDPVVEFTLPAHK